MKNLNNMSQADVNLQLKTSGLAPSNPSTGWSALSLGLAKIILVYPEEMRCSIEVVAGELGRQTFAGVEISAAGAGARHFLGAVPEVGDFCVVGWFAKNSTKADKKSPIILTWLPRTHFFGHDWLPVQDFSPDESMTETPRQRDKFKSVIGRTRFKMRHMEAGNVIASSSQGSDLILDESAVLMNRRSNEIRLRDQDQAIVMRSIQQFQTMAGARVYSGLVQRDARTLPREMVSDGQNWDADEQLDSEGRPLDKFPDLDSYPSGVLTPHKLFLKGDNGFSTFEEDGGEVPDYLNPYEFLGESSLISSDSFFYDGDEGLTYGGKSILRVASNGEEAGLDALTEYRVELNHKSNGTLPVSEQTDGFDVDRLEGGSPFVEFVLGSVVGNDPFKNKDQYGKPLGVSFETGEGSLGVEIDDLFEQAATLLRVNGIDPDTDASFTSFSKAGAFRAHIGNSSEDAVRTSVSGGVFLTSGGPLRAEASRVALEASEVGEGISLRSAKGSVHIYAGGSTNSGLEDRSAQEGVKVEAVKAISIQSGVSFKVTSPIVDFSEVQSILLNSNEGLSLSSGKSIELRTSDQKEVISGYKKTLIAGPSDGNPLNAQGLETTIATSPATGSVGGVVKKETIVSGDELKETKLNGNRVTKTSVGNIESISDTGSVVNKAGRNQIETSASSGISLKAVLGDVKVNSVIGSVNIEGSVSIGLRSVGPVTIQASATVLGGAPGPANGPIMCGSDVHPLIGKTYLELGMPPRTQILKSG